MNGFSVGKKQSMCIVISNAEHRGSAAIALPLRIRKSIVMAGPTRYLLAKNIYIMEGLRTRAEKHRNFNIPKKHKSKLHD